MRTVITFSLVVVVYSLAFTQSKRDYIWMEGKNFTDSLPGMEGTYFDWRSGEFDYYYLPLTNEIGASNASICDEQSGKLLFYSNGCRILNSNHEVMENGEEINSGFYYHDYCFDDATNAPNDTYPSRNNDLILPDPNDPNGYYHFTKRRVLDTLSFVDGVFMSYVDMSYNAGLGKVVEKGVHLLDSIPFLSSYSKACLHDNGKDWWIVLLERYSNNFHKLLVNEDGITYFGHQDFGREIVGSSAGNMSFSPTGDLMAVYSVEDDLILLDFDNSTGEFSNYQLLDFPEDELLGLFSGLEFSPSGEYLYIASWKKLLQVDLNNLDFETGVELVGEWTPPTDGDVGLDYFSHALLGPDCKIYVTPGNGVNYAHVIHEPNARGLDCDFEFRAIKYPYSKNISSLPNYPKFRTADELCNLTPSSNSEVENTLNKFSLYPNPVEEILFIEYDGLCPDIECIITNSLGIEVDLQVGSFDNSQIDVSALPVGFYNCSIRCQSEDIITKRFVKL